MADKKISDLPALATADAADVIPLVDVSGAVTKKVAVSGLAAAVAASLPDSSISGTALSNYRVTRQNNTTNSTETTSRILTGWGVFAQATASNKSEAVTFSTPFTAPPIVTITYAGDQVGGTIAYGNGGNSEKGGVTIKAYGQSTTGFTAHAHTTDASSWSSTTNVYYTWIAIGI